MKEHFWTDASPANKFIRTDGSELAKKQTIAKVALGKDAIYFAFVCSLRSPKPPSCPPRGGKPHSAYGNEPAPKKLSANVDRRDGDIGNDEAVIVSLAPHNEDEMVYQFGVNCEGIQYDSKGGRKEWNGKWKSRTRINDENWTVEMAIPYSVLELLSPPKKAEHLFIRCV